MFGRTRKENVVGLYIERADVFEKEIGIFLAEDFHIFEREREPLALKADRHFIGALIGVRRKVSEVGDVDDLLDRVMVVLERATQDVGEDEHREVADVLA